MQVLEVSQQHPYCHEVYGPYDIIEIYNGFALVKDRESYQDVLKGVIPIPTGYAYVVRKACADEELYDTLRNLPLEQLEMIRNFMKTTGIIL